MRGSFVPLTEREIAALSLKGFEVSNQVCFNRTHRIQLGLKLKFEVM